MRQRSRERVMMESLVSFIEKIIKDDNPEKIISKISDEILDNFKLNSSVKHLRHVDMEFGEAA